MRGTKRTPAEKVLAMAMAETVGNADAARQTGIPLRTVQGWRAEGLGDEALERRVQEMVDASWAEITVEGAKLAKTAATILAEALEAIHESKSHLGMTPSQLMSISLIGGLWVDKLRNLPTQATRAGAHEPTPANTPHPSLLPDSPPGLSGLRMLESEAS